MDLSDLKRNRQSNLVEIEIAHDFESQRPTSAIDICREIQKRRWNDIDVSSLIINSVS